MEKSEFTLERQDPTTVSDCWWVFAENPDYNEKIDGEVYGKWLVFRPLEEIDEMWRTIRGKLESGELGSPGAKCSTLRYNPGCTGPGPVRSAVVCVYTTKTAMDKVGMKLIPLVRNDIRYKTDEATLNCIYKHTSTHRTTIKTLYWNDGNPSFEQIGKSNRGPRPDIKKEDPWKINQVKASEPIVSEKTFGRWVVAVDYERINELWHYLKEMVESGEMEAKEMVCPPKRDNQDPYELPEFHIFTSETRKDSVGLKLKEINHKLSDKAFSDVRYEIVFDIDPHIQCKAQEPLASEEKHGKWVIETDYDKLHELWSTLSDKVKSGELGAKEMVRPLPKQHPCENPQIHVFTSKGRVDQVGFKLIQIVRNNIVYKPLEDPWTHRRGANGQHSTGFSGRTLYWNDAEPDYENVSGIARNCETDEEM